MLAVIADRERELREHQAAGQLLSDYRSHQNLRAWPRFSKVFLPTNAPTSFRKWGFTNGIA